MTGNGSIEIRPERPIDAAAIGAVTAAAFAKARHRSGQEAAIVDGLRADGALAISLVATERGHVVGHAAFSPVAIASAPGGWFGLGPLSVRPDRQRQGVGQALVRRGLHELRRRAAAGCVVLGDPHYYARFGFAADPALRYGDLPLQYLRFDGPMPTGAVAYHRAFDAAGPPPSEDAAER